jgi:cellulose biosynthesis protein BcsE
MVYSEDTPILTMVWPTLLAASRIGPAQWITERDPDRQLTPSTAHADAMRQALVAGHIQSFVWGGSTVAPSFRRIFEELDYFAPAKGGLVVLDGADRLFAGADPAATDAALAACQQWAERRASTLLLLCPRRSDRTDPAAILRSAAHRLGGFTRLHPVDSGLVWEVFHWFGPEGILANRSLRLSIGADSRLMVADDQAPRHERELATDENAVFITHASLPPGQPAPAAWQVVEDLDAAVTAMSNATAATVVLHHNQTGPLATLARTVFSLRKARGNRIKIVVREINARLRYSQEHLITGMGANLVVSAEVAFSRFLGMIEMVQGQVFSRPLANDYKEAVTAIATPAKRGYLTPSAFIETVAAIMARARVLDVQCVLIRLPLARGLTPADALRYCSMRRPGDLCTADLDSIYVFLFACRESDITLTLERLFRLPVAELFEGEDRCLSPETIHHATQMLATAVQTANWSDLSMEFAIEAGQPVPATQVVPTTPTPVHGTGLHHAPSLAVRRPLQLRRSRPGEFAS